MKAVIPIHLGEYETVVYDGIPQQQAVVENVIIEPAETGDPHTVRLTLPAGLNSVLLPRDLFSERIQAMKAGGADEWCVGVPIWALREVLQFCDAQHVGELSDKQDTAVIALHSALRIAQGQIPVTSDAAQTSRHPSAG